MTSILKPVLWGANKMIDITKKQHHKMASANSKPKIILQLAQLLTISVFPIVALSIIAPAHAANTDTLVNVAVGENTEKAATATNFGSNGFSISVDGERVAGDQLPVDTMRLEDIDLEKVDIQVKFDGLGVEPTLNVSTSDLRHSYQAGDTIRFLATSNYPAWISKSEIRIYRKENGVRTRPVAVVDVGYEGEAQWRMSAQGNEDFVYVLRVYDNQGRYDETSPLGLARTSSAFPTHLTAPEGEAVSPGNGEDRTAVRNIPVYGGAVTVYGRYVPNGYKVKAFGEKIPIDNNSAFVVQRILPPGDHSIDVDVMGSNQKTLAFNREINIPWNEWFYVGLADITLGKRFGSSAVVPVGPGEFNRYYSKGRLAFYLKGKIRGKYLLTAAADTGEDELQNLFKGLDSKDPRQILRRIDPDDFYPVYGDDSTSIEDAPTQGKFYVRLERGDSHVLWGNYKTTIKGTEFARNERALYGAHALYRSSQVTSYGERKAEVEAYAAQPGTLPYRDTLRGTGGSVYFLTRQDITRGSETINIEVKDPLTGIVKSRKLLVYGKDYEIDYLQGVIILRQPLSSTSSDGLVVTSGALGDNHVNLVAQYEYTPTSGNVDGYSYGGRAQAWLGDNVRVGITAMKEQTGLADHNVLAGDIHIRLAENSYIQAEISKSKGPGFSSSNSINGGLTINTNGSAGTAKQAIAYRLEAAFDVADFSDTQTGRIGAYYERRDTGFSSPGYDTRIGQRVWGAHADVKVDEYLRYRLAYEDFNDDAGKLKREGDAEVEFTIAPQWLLALGVKHTELANPISIAQNGRRTDVGAKITYKIDDDNQIYVFGQKTVTHSGKLERNDRLGIGAKTRISEKLSVNGEVSNGTSGWGGYAGLEYDPTADDHYYIGYKVDPNRGLNSSSLLSGIDLGSVVIGAKRRYSDTLSSYAENSYDMFGQRRSLTSTYGVVYTPSALWTINVGAEFGNIDDPNGAEITRSAVSASIGYNEKDQLTWRVRGEARFDDSIDPAKDRDTYLASATLAIKQDDNWRFLAHADAAISNTDQTSILNGDYIEASVGYAYRPIDNDKLNALFKYTYLYDLPGPDQVTVNGATLGPAQQSHILSADVSYDLNQYLTVGAKYGFRIGKVSATRANKDFVKSSAHLGVVRADFHVIKNWDILLEARVLSTPEIETTQWGALAAIYRHFGNNLKVGVGYNFGSFSDDVSDLTYDDGGVFLNVVGKF